MRLIVSHCICLFFTLLVTMAGFEQASAVGDTESTNLPGAQAPLLNEIAAVRAFSPVLSADGRYMAFVSEASNLVAGDTNGKADVFVFDRLTKAVERVSVATNGTQADDDCKLPAISADGNVIGFLSSSNTLVPGDTTASAFNVDVFVHDRRTGRTERVNVASDGTEARGGEGGLFRGPESSQPALSADGRFVAFTSWATNLVTNDTNDWQDVFVHDRLSHTTERVSISSLGTQGFRKNGSNTEATPAPAISSDGRLVAFHSYFSDLGPTDTTTGPDLYLHDRSTHQTELVGVASNGLQGEGINLFDPPSMSADGRFVAFTADQPLAPGPTNGFLNVFVRDRTRATTELISITTEGRAFANSIAESPTVSADGRFVGFILFNEIDSPSGTTFKRDVYLRDRVARNTTLLSVANDGSPANGNSVDLALSADGRIGVFQSFASNLTTNGIAGQGSLYTVRDRLLDQTKQADVVIRRKVLAGPKSPLARGPTLLRRSSNKAKAINFKIRIFNKGPSTARQLALTTIASSGCRIKKRVATPLMKCGTGALFVCRVNSLAAGLAAEFILTLKARDNAPCAVSASTNAPPVDKNPFNNAFQNIFNNLNL